MYFSSLDDVDVVDLAFIKAQGGLRHFRLLVDSGFTGHSWFVLLAAAQDIVQAPAPNSEAIGALSGPGLWCFLCQVPALGFGAVGIAILSGMQKLALPTGVDGIVGLQFLRQFERWGAERIGGKWRFFLETKSTKNGVS